MHQSPLGPNGLSSGPEEKVLGTGVAPQRKVSPCVQLPILEEWGGTGECPEEVCPAVVQRIVHMRCVGRLRNVGFFAPLAPWWRGSGQDRGCSKDSFRDNGAFLLRGRPHEKEIMPELVAWEV